MFEQVRNMRNASSQQCPARLALELANQTGVTSSMGCCGPEHSLSLRRRHNLRKHRQFATISRKHFSASDAT
jgi:hypothetical protein